MATQSTLITVSDFGPRLKVLKQLQKDAGDAYRAAAGAILKFAIEYASLYESVRKDKALVAALNSGLDLDDWEATRWRTIAGQAKPLKSIQKCLPPAFESIYEVARSLKQDEKPVLRAAEDEKLTPSSSMREIRDIGKKRRAGSHTPHKRSSKASRIQVNSLKSLGMTFVFPLDAVPRPDDIDELRVEVSKVLAKYKARFVGLARVTKANDDHTVEQHLETYWALKDEAATLKSSDAAEEKADLEDRWSKLFEGGKVWS